MAVFTIAAGQTLRMDKMVGNGSWAHAGLFGRSDGSVEWRWVNSNTAPETILYQAISTEAVFTPPFSNESPFPTPNFFSLGDITVDMTFFDPEFGPGPVGALTGTTWHDVTLIEYIYYVVGTEGLTPIDYLYLFDFAGPVLFGGDDIVTLGAGNDVFYDYGGALQATLGAGDDAAWLYEDGQGVVDEKYVNAGDGNDKVYYQSGNGTILGGAGNDEIGGAGNSDGNWLFNGGAGRDTIYAYKESRIEDNKGSGNDTYYSYLPGSSAQGIVVSYASGNKGIVVDLAAGTASGGGHGTDILSGIRSVEGTAAADTMIGARFNSEIASWGVRLWGMGGADSIFGGDWHDELDGGKDADAIDGAGGNDTIVGGTGNDTIIGGVGADVLTGGAGEDDFVYLGIEESTRVVGERDIIRGFQDGVDDIDLSAIGGLSFIGTAAFTAVNQIRYEQHGNKTTVFVNTEGKSGAEMYIDLSGVHTLTADDFIL